MGEYRSGLTGTIKGRVASAFRGSNPLSPIRDNKMKILFICKANVGRSQMAEAFYEKYSDEKEVKSAGCSPGDWEGKNLDQTRYVKLCMDEEGIDIRKKISKKVSKEMVDWADRVIVFHPEKKDWPDFLQNSEKVEVWEVEDPGGKDLEVHRIARDKIKKIVKEITKIKQQKAL